MDTLESLRLASRLRLREGDNGTATVGQPTQPQAQTQGAATQSQADLVKAFQQALEGIQQNLMDHIDDSLKELGESLVKSLKGSNGSKNSNDSEQSEQNAGSKSGMSSSSNANNNGGNNNGN